MPAWLTQKFQQIWFQRTIEAEIKELAEEALSLDEDQQEALVVLGLYENFQNWDWDEAERMYKKALESNPNNREAYLELAYLYMRTLRVEQALIEAQKAYELDPLLRRTQQVLIDAYGLNDREEEAMELLREWGILDSENPTIYHYRGIYEAKNGRIEEAYESFTKFTELTGQISASAGVFYWRNGYTDLYESKLQQIESNGDMADKALFYSATGDPEKGVFWLEKDLEQNPLRRLSLYWYHGNLKDEPGFRNLVREAIWRNIFTKERLSRAIYNSNREESAFFMSNCRCIFVHVGDKRRKKSSCVERLN